MARPFELFGLEFLPVPVLHGSQTIYGFRFGSAAYLTDHSDIPESSLEQLRGLDVLFLDALRYKPHPTHSTVERSTRPWRAGRRGAPSSPTSATTWRTSAPKACCRRTSGWPTTAWKSRWRARAVSHADLPQPGRGPADFGPTALTIGNFDGVHFGHRRILRRLKALAAERGWKASVLTFDPHPTRVVAPERAPRLMTSPERRAELMQEEGIEQVLILPFTRELAQLSPEEFVRRLLVERAGRARRAGGR